MTALRRSFLLTFIFVLCLCSEPDPIAVPADCPFLPVPQVFIFRITQVSGLLGTVLDSVSVFPESYNLAQIESPDSLNNSFKWKKQNQEREYS